MTLAMRMSLAFLTSSLLFGCAHDEPTLRIMNDRAEYQDEAPETSELNLSTSGAFGEAGNLPVRPDPRVALVWVYPQRLSEHEHFWGAWVSLRLEDDHWESKTANTLEPAAPSTSKAKKRPLKKKAQ